jgi:hypothetical protein
MGKLTKMSADNVCTNCMIVEARKHDQGVEWKSSVRRKQGIFSSIVVMGGTQNWRQSLGRNKTMITSRS